MLYSPNRNVYKTRCYIFRNPSTRTVSAMNNDTDTNSVPVTRTRPRGPVHKIQDFLLGRDGDTMRRPRKRQAAHVNPTKAAWDPLLDKIRLFTEIVEGIPEVRKSLTFKITRYRHMAHL
jgi:hypothetical protein